MSTGTIQLGTLGIKKTLSHYSPSEAIFEYIWNGFDAHATKVNVTAKVAHEGWDLLESITVSDDGDGILHGGLDKSFKPFLESSKAKQQGKYRSSETQGKEGRGRLTFFKFAERAVWKTRCVVNGQVEEYEIKITSDDLQHYEPTKPVQVDVSKGTEIKFEGINAELGLDFISNAFLEALKIEFGWFLKLNESKGFMLFLNGKAIDYQSLILAEDKVGFIHEATRTSFSVEFIHWQEKATDYSKFYYLDSKGFERFKQNTNFNNKGDGFNHSLFIRSRYFDDWKLEKSLDASELNFGGDREPFQFLKSELTKYLRKQRKKILRGVADAMIESYESDQVFPSFSKTSYDRYRFDDLKEVIRTVYEADPRVFFKLNLQQKKTFVGFLNLLLDSDERERLLTVLEHVIQLDQDEQKQLVVLLQTAELNQIIRTMTLIKSRFEAVHMIKELVFNKALKANEVHDLQAAVEAHYWLFGEEFHLVTAAEPSFETALRRFTHILEGEVKLTKMEHPDKEKEMDIFAIREIVHAQRVESIIVELKHPHNITLGMKELNQVKKYMRVILDEPQFNGGNRDWKFFLVGKAYTDEIEGELKNSKGHGESSLVYHVDNVKIYVKTWDEVFTEFQCKHNFLNENLSLKYENIQKAQPKGKEAIAALLKDSPARMSGQITTDTPFTEIKIGI